MKWLSRASLRAPIGASLVAVIVGACALNPDKRTLAELRDVEPDLAEVTVEDGLERAMEGYARFLAEAPKSGLTPEAMRRLADLKLEREYGILGGAQPAKLPAPSGSTALPQPTTAAPEARPATVRTPGVDGEVWETAEAFEVRATDTASLPASGAVGEVVLPDGRAASSNGPLEAIALYDEILAAYPDYEHNDRVLYQKARAYDELGRPEDAIRVAEELIARYPHSTHIDEVQFRRAEYFFVRRRFLDAEAAYQAITALGPVSDFYELALYKLGWTFYKQLLYPEALDQYVALLDHKVATGYDFDQAEDEDSERRIADTFRVVSLSFSSIGGPDEVTRYFAEHGERSYEDRIYRHLGEFYFDKLRYQDAASAYETFVGLHPMHRSAPLFGIRVVEIYEAGGFPKLVLASKKDFAARYGVASPYWQQHDIAKSEKVVDYLKVSLRDLANHYHATYQDPEKAAEKAASFAEAVQWYRSYLASFPKVAGTPAIHYQLADLLLEDERFGDAALEYEHTAYGYAAHEQSAAAGYAAIFAHREQQKRAEPGAEHDAVREAAVASTLRFVDAHPKHEHAAVVLGAAVDDLFQMGRLEETITLGRRLIGSYADADPAVVRSAWLAVAHAAFDLADYPQAEQAYVTVLEQTDSADESRQGVVDNLAAAIYRQGELAREAKDHRAAADHFLRIAKAAPTSSIRAGAEYDAGAELIVLEEWDDAVSVLDAFRESHPDHALHGEATKQLASVYRTQGELSLAAGEYERIAAESEDDEVRREALLVAADLYEDDRAFERALGVYREYLERYPDPLELAIETRFGVAKLLEGMGRSDERMAELRKIVDLDRRAGEARTDRIRTLAARSALVLTEGLFDRFAEVRLVQPFEQSLARKRKRMDEALEGFGRLVDYEVGDVTAAATYYTAEIYRDFSASLMASERPDGLSASDLAEYELVLEEEAYPFEEQAIEVHQKNLELMDAGVYNRWIEKSLARLGDVMPGRYAKPEESTGLVDSVDRYAYVPPGVEIARARAEAGVADPASEPAEVAAQHVAEEAVEPAPLTAEAPLVPAAPADDEETTP